MNPEIDYTLAFIAGIFGTPHCLGMCSGISGAVFLRSGRRIAYPLALYHGTRVATYATIGVAGALLGRVLEQSGLFGKVQGLLMMAAGVAVMVLGLRTVRDARVNRCASQCRSGDSAADASPSPSAFLLGGLVNGLIPCSLVFSVAIKAVFVDPVHAGLLMLSFGLGTLPGVLPVGILAAWDARTRGLWLQLGGLCVILLGAKTSYEGLVFFNIIRGLANG